LVRWRQLHAEGQVPPQSIIDRAIELVLAGEDREAYAVLDVLQYDRATPAVRKALARLTSAFASGAFDSKSNTGILLANAAGEIDEAFEPILVWLEQRRPWSPPVEWAFSGLWGWVRRDVPDARLKTERIKRARHICELYGDQPYAQKLLQTL
jgi:hypothetical protein